MRIIALLFILLLMTSGAIYAQYDTTCGIVWGPIVQLSKDSMVFAVSPRIAAQGETLHVTWWAGGYRLPYARSTDGGLTWEPTRELLPDSVTYYLPANDDFILANSKKVFILFIGPNNFGRTPPYVISSSDRGLTWSDPVATIISDTSTRLQMAAILGDTIVFFHRGSTKLVRTTNGGQTWTKSQAPLTYFGGNALAITPGILHNLYDDFNPHPAIEIGYKRSYSLGDSWYDSLILSTVDDNYSDIPALGSSRDDSGNFQLFATWREGKYAPCQALVGCSLPLRRSSDAGSIWQPEILMTDLPNGYNNGQSTGQIASFGNRVGYAWTNDAISHINFRYSMNGGLSWSGLCDVTPQNSAAEPSCAVTPSAFHVVWTETKAGCPICIAIFYRRGTLLPTTVNKLDDDDTPRKFRLDQNYPNPFNPSTSIRYELPAGERRAGTMTYNVSLNIYDVLGQQVASLINERKESGRHEVTWDGTLHPSGVYYYRLTIHSPGQGAWTETKKMLLLK